MSIDPSTSGTLDFKQASKVTFVGSSSNTVIDTVTGSFGIGVDVNGPSSNLHVVGNTRLEGDINMLHTSNNAAIKLNSNVVTEFPRSKKLIKYPRVALTGSTSGGYTAQTSSINVSTQDAWYAFDNIEPDDNTSRWRTASTRYTNSGATPPSEYLFTGSEAGDWISIELPEKMRLVYYTMTGIHTHTPQEGVIYGYDSDTSTWHKVSTFYFDTTSYPVNNTPLFSPEFHVGEGVGMYSKYAMIVTKTNGSDAPSLYEWKLYGIPEYDPEAHGTDVKVTSYPNVPNTDWLEVYYDAKNYSGSGDVQDETANDIDATIGAATTFDSVNKAWSFSGTSNRDGTEFVSGYLPSDFEGQQIHSVSMWLKFDYWHNGSFCIIGKETRTTGDSHKAIHFQFQGTDSGSPKILYDFWSNQKSFYLPGDVQPGKWLHMTATYSGDAANRKMFVNGQELTTFTTNSAYATELALDTTNDLVVRLGTRFPVNSLYTFHGDIANFRLFNRPLTSDEIWQLYAYQKEYFGHGDLSMTFKAGRLGIGTSEPRAALDVRGDIYGGCPAYFSGHLTSNYGGIGIVPWDTIHIIKGCSLDTSTGQLTIGIKGKYRVYYTARQVGSNTTSIYLRTRVNGTQLGTGYGAIYLNTTRDQAGTTIILDLDVNDVIDIYSPGSDGSIASNYNAFTVEYLSSI